MRLVGAERQPGRPHMPGEHESRGTVGAGGMVDVGGISARLTADIAPGSIWVGGSGELVLALVLVPLLYPEKDGG